MGLFLSPPLRRAENGWDEVCSVARQVFLLVMIQVERLEIDGECPLEDEEVLLAHVACKCLGLWVGNGAYGGYTALWVTTARLVIFGDVGSHIAVSYTLKDVISVLRDGYTAVVRFAKGMELTLICDRIEAMDVVEDAIRRGDDSVKTSQSLCKFSHIPFSSL